LSRDDKETGPPVLFIASKPFCSQIYPCILFD